MTCSQCQGIEDFFSQRQAERQLRRYRKHGPAKTTRLLLAALEAEGVDGLTLLDIGGGIGAIPLALLRAGVTSATDVDASTGYLAVAKAEAERDGLTERIAYRFGNFVDLAAEVPSAGVVTLDRVICCYHDPQRLVGLSSAKAARLYGVVYPRDAWWTRTLVWLPNLAMRLRRSPFRVFVHPSATVDALARGSGLVPRFRRSAGFWQVVVYARPT
ncbi:MAG TPA: methyltransferase domain-containing protein [Ktedonobacterales bacterium]